MSDTKKMIYLHWLIFIVYVCVVLVTMVTVLMDNRQPAKTMAWVMVLIFIPVIGIVLYFFFGQNTRKEKYISSQSMDQLTKRSMLEFAEQQDLKLPEEHSTLIKLFGSLNWALPFKNNETDIFTDGHSFFCALLGDIGRATHHIHLETYIICDDPLGRLVADVLMDKARAGVEVRFIYDDVGCWNVSNSFFERMRTAGVDVHAFMPVKFPAFTSKVNYRNHRKLIVIDGKIGYTGGLNVAERYRKGNRLGLWRDTFMRTLGPAVHAMQYSFLNDWAFVGQKKITDDKYFPAPLFYDNNCIQLVTSGPDTDWQNIMQGIIMAMSNAHDYIYIHTPYYLPPDSVTNALETAAMSGVDVRIIMPERNDSRLVAAASRHQYGDSRQDHRPKKSGKCFHTIRF